MLRVIDLTQQVAGPFATLLLAELGADVIKVEPPHEGDPWRTRSQGEPDQGSFDYLNRRKRSLSLDLASKQGHALLLRLVADADAVVESFSPGTLGRLRLSYRTLKRANPNLILTSISNFGQSGPRRDWQATELVLQAMGGVVAGTGWEDRFPLKLAGYQACHIAGLNAATATLAAFFGARAGTMSGAHIDVSIQECLPPHWARHVSEYAYSGTLPRRERRENGRQGFPHTAMASDGWLYLLALRAEWESFAYFLGLEQFVTHEFSDSATRAQRWPEIEPHFHTNVAARSKYDWFAAASELGYTFAPIESPQEIMEGPHYAARAFFQPATLTTGATHPVAGLPFSHSMRPDKPNRAPHLGEHTDEILTALALNGDEIRALRSAQVIQEALL